MTKLISAASHAASKILAQEGHSIKRSHLAEVLAAMLGYQTYAALVIEENDSDLEYHLDDAAMLVLNRPMAEQRAQALGLLAVPALLQAGTSTLQKGAGVPVYEDLDQFYEEFAREALVDTITSSDETANTMAETNAYFDSDPEMPEEVPDTEDLWEARTSWSIEACGDFAGSHDLDSDRMFSGDKLNCFAKLIFDKAGRSGLILVDSEGSASVDDTWRELDRDAEEAYIRSLDVQNHIG